MAWLLAQLWETEFVLCWVSRWRLGKEGAYVRQKKGFGGTAFDAERSSGSYTSGRMSANSVQPHLRW